MLEWIKVLGRETADRITSTLYRRAQVARNDITEFAAEVLAAHSYTLSTYDVYIRARPQRERDRSLRSIGRRGFDVSSKGTRRECHGARAFVAPLEKYLLPQRLFAELPYVDTERACVDLLRHSSYSHDPTAHLHNLLHSEESCVRASLREYDIDEAVFTRGSFGLLRLRVPGLAEKRPSVLVDDMIEAVDEANRRCHQGYVHYVYHDEIDVSFSSHVMVGAKYSIHFTCKRTDFCLLHRAVDRTLELGRPLLTIADTEPTRVPPDAIDSAPLAALNELQEAFVRDTAAATERLRILWGPPGTGKTTTVVAYIAGIVTAVAKRHRHTTTTQNFKVLVATPSNGASNLVVSKLLKFLNPDDILRVMALSRATDEVPEDVRSCCCTDTYFDEQQDKDVIHFRSPTPDELERALVVVATLGSCGRIYGMHPTVEFTHVVVDECGQATEPELAAALQFNGLRRVVCAGDPKQLGPITVSMAARAKGLDCSPLVRLISHEGAHATTLRECYRCHPSILQAFNPVFYDGLLVPARTGVKFTTSPVPGFPRLRVKWVHCSGSESYDRKSPSIMNIHEVDIVVRELHRLLVAGVSKDDVVVLAPYALQVKKLREMLRLPPTAITDRTWLTNHVCSVEAFQGREAKVVILSCVRSPEDFDESPQIVAADARRQLGFLSQPQRTNVALSRAIDGMIIIGNLRLLAQDTRVWGRVLEMRNTPLPCAEFDTGFVTPSLFFATLGPAPSASVGAPPFVESDADEDAADTTQHGIRRLEE